MDEDSSGLGRHYKVKKLCSKSQDKFQGINTRKIKKKGKKNKMEKSTTRPRCTNVGGVRQISRGMCAIPQMKTWFYVGDGTSLTPNCRLVLKLVSSNRGAI